MDGSLFDGLIQQGFRGGVVRPAVEHLHLTGYHLGKVAHLTRLFVPVGLQAPFDVRQAPFGQVFSADFSQATPGFYIEPIRRLFSFALGAVPMAGDSQTEAGDALAAGS